MENMQIVFGDFVKIEQGLISFNRFPGIVLSWDLIVITVRCHCHRKEIQAEYQGTSAAKTWAS